MRKGFDPSLFRKVKIDNFTGKVASDTMVLVRPTFGVKELARRKAARKVAKASRKRNR